MEHVLADTNSEILTDKSKSEKMKKLLDSDYFYVVRRDKTDKFHIYVQKDVVRLADAFGVNIAYNTKADDLYTAMLVVGTIHYISSNILLNAVMQFEKCKNQYNDGDISFLRIFEDMSQLNAMVNGLTYCYKITRFKDLQALCGRLAASLDISSATDIINEKIGKEYGGWNFLFEESIYRLRETYEKAVGQIRNSPCFNREAFAMLYVYLAPYVQKEEEYEKVLQAYCKFPGIG